MLVAQLDSCHIHSVRYRCPNFSFLCVMSGPWTNGTSHGTYVIIPSLPSRHFLYMYPNHSFLQIAERTKKLVKGDGSGTNKLQVSVHLVHYIAANVGS